MTKQKKARDEAWAIGNKLAGIGERRVAWAELMKAINECLPKLPPLAAGKKPQDIPIEDRGTIYVDSVDCQYYPNLTAQKEAMLKLATEDEPKAAAAQEGENPPATAPAQSPPPEPAGGAGSGSEPATAPRRRAKVAGSSKSKRITTTTKPVIPILRRSTSVARCCMS